MSIRKPQFPAQIWDGTAQDRNSRLLEINPLHPSYDQLVAELIATQEFASGLVGGLTSPYSTEAGVDLLKGNPVYIDGAGRLQKARNDLVIAHQVAGLMLDAAAAFTSGDYIADGSLELTDWTNIAGVASLTRGAIYYLSNTPGMITSTAPTAVGFYVVQIGRAVSTTKLDIELGQPIRL